MKVIRPTVIKISVLSVVAFQYKPKWIQCQECNEWMHVRYIDIDKKLSGEELADLAFVCETCA